MNVCMCVYMRCVSMCVCVCVCECMCVCSVCVYMCVYACVYLCVYVCVCVRAHICMFTINEICLYGNFPVFANSLIRKVPEKSPEHY